jgi:hypothetical protein
MARTWTHQFVVYRLTECDSNIQDARGSSRGRRCSWSAHPGNFTLESVWNNQEEAEKEIERLIEFNKFHKQPNIQYYLCSVKKFLGKKELLLALCEKFIKEQDITCSETIYQMDNVIQNAYEFIEGIADIVGYAKVK